MIKPVVELSSFLLNPNLSEVAYVLVARRRARIELGFVVALTIQSSVDIYVHNLSLGFELAQRCLGVRFLQRVAFRAGSLCR
jgi:hypothetical protein